MMWLPSCAYEICLHCILFQEAFRAFHNDQDFVRKFMKTLHVGNIGQTEQDKDLEMKKDFEELRQTAHKMVRACSQNRSYI